MLEFLSNRKGEKNMQQSNERKVVFIDVDGTLLPGGGSVSEYDKEMLRRLRKQGDLVVLNTGRSYAYIPENIRSGDYFDGIVAGGGAYVMMNGRTLYSAIIPEDILLMVSRLYLSIGKWCKFEGVDSNYAVRSDDPACQPVVAAEDFLTRYKGAQVSKITMEGEVSEDEREALHSYFFIYKHGDYSEGFIRGESKTSGIEHVLREVGIDKKHTVGIGDSVNDAEMLINTGFGIAMGNACPEVKQIADVITLDCYHSGVGKAVEEYLLR